MPLAGIQNKSASAESGFLALDLVFALVLFFFILFFLFYPLPLTPFNAPYP
jgi:hypothetical protein